MNKMNRTDFELVGRRYGLFLSFWRHLRLWDTVLL